MQLLNNHVHKIYILHNIFYSFTNANPGKLELPSTFFELTSPMLKLILRDPSELTEDTRNTKTQVEPKAHRGNKEREETTANYCYTIKS